MNRGKFITFEGPDGSGKTTVSKAVCEKLLELGYPVRYTREPGGSRIAEAIRDIILDPQNTEMDARCEALLYAASRRQHLTDIVLPSLEAGTHVICDRFVDSSIAYQGYARGIGAEEVLAVNAFAIDDVMPEKTIFLNLSAEEGLKRIEAGHRTADRLDQESIAFHQAVYDGYQKVLESDPERMIVIDASRALEEVVSEVLDRIREILDA
ncbi:MAG: dTMP kinase [Solobacterium sp.]|nr:dTMP kinase [Solobacterium sp.]